MAVLETKIYTALTGNVTVAAVVSARVYPLIMPQDPTLPAITYQRMGSDPVNDLQGYSGLENAHIMLNSWGTRYDTVKELAEDVHEAMDKAGTFKSVLVNDMDGYDPDTGLYVVSQDFSCWDVTT